MIKLNIALLLIVSLAGFSCNHTFKSSKQYLEYINNPRHGLTKLNKIGKLTFGLKYLPVQYLALNEIEQLQEYENLSIQKKDSIAQSYGENLTFLFTISEENGRNQQFDTIKSSIKSDLLNSESTCAFQLYTDGKYSDPVLQTVEYDGGIGKSYNYYLVFPKSSHSISSNEIIISFKDKYFTNKIIEFSFNKSDLEKIPCIDF